MNKIHLSLLFIAGVVFISCNKSETVATSPLNNYNLQVPGKYITYKLDSIVFLNFGSQITDISYFAKDVVDSPIIDNLGRKGYRIYRYIRQDSTAPWQINNTFLTIPTSNSIEYIENNLRFVKLHAPVQNYFKWKGNAYIDTYDNVSGTTFDWNLSYLDDWDYTYQNVNQPAVVGSATIDSTLTVNECDETYGDSTDANAYSERNYSQEIYAKGIGLVYRTFLHKVYQPGSGSYTSDSYGIILTMLDHN